MKADKKLAVGPVRKSKANHPPGQIEVREKTPKESYWQKVRAEFDKTPAKLGGRRVRHAPY